MGETWRVYLKIVDFGIFVGGNPSLEGANLEGLGANKLLRVPAKCLTR